MQIGFADFNVITKNRVEFDLERVDAGALALALFNLRDVLLAVAAQVAQFVALFVDPSLNHAAVTQRNGRLADNGFLNPLPQVAQLVDGTMQRAQTRSGKMFQRLAHGGFGRVEFHILNELPDLLLQRRDSILEPPNERGAVECYS